MDYREQLNAVNGIMTGSLCPRCEKPKKYRSFFWTDDLWGLCVGGCHWSENDKITRLEAEMIMTMLLAGYNEDL